MPSGILVVLVTCPTPAVGRRIGKRVVQERLAACVNLLPGIESHFRWQGRLDRAAETLLLIKTTPAAWPRLRRRIVALHPYDVPEVIALPVVSGSAPYLRWVRDSVARPA